MTNELARAGRIEIPSARCRARKTFLTTCLVHPPHLPGGVLSQSLLPLVICPKETDAVMPLPYRYWPTALRNRA